MEDFGRVKEGLSDQKVAGSNPARCATKLLPWIVICHWNKLGLDLAGQPVKMHI